MAEPEAKQDAVRVVGSVDRVIHEPAKLMIMMVLSSVDRADYIFLMRATGLAWGNLSSHLSKLEAAGYVKITKTFVNKKPHTMANLTPRCRAAIKEYGHGMQSALRGSGLRTCSKALDTSDVRKSVGDSSEPLGAWSCQVAPCSRKPAVLRGGEERTHDLRYLARRDGTVLGERIDARRECRLAGDDQGRIDSVERQDAAIVTSRVGNALDTFKPVACDTAPADGNPALHAVPLHSGGLTDASVSPTRPMTFLTWPTSPDPPAPPSSMVIPYGTGCIVPAQLRPVLTPAIVSSWTQRKPWRNPS
ncbi:MAG TPA: transcriptional regulator [Anaerolineales bacterium]|nr:transcriptional regulator [Anaerolineales bacterium]